MFRGPLAALERSVRFLVGIPLVAMLPICAVLLGACSSTQSVPEMSPVIGTSTKASAIGVANSTGTQLYIVRLSAAPLTTYAGGVPGLAPTNPAVTGARSLDLNSPASRAYLTYLKAQQEKFLAAMDTVLGRTVAPTFVYFYAMNGMTVKLAPAEAARVAKLPGVVSVRKDMPRPPLETAPKSPPLQ